MSRRITENEIINEVKQAAVDHLNSKSAEEALVHFTKDIIAVSNEKLFPSYDELEKDVKDYYNILERINYAKWSDIKILVINNDAATFTAKFKYSFTSIDDEVTNLKGIWTALFVRESGNWKIRLRHETFSE
jgi:ketosteroid isomerase-like protein